MSSEAEQLKAEGNAYFGAGRNAEALASYKAAIRLTSKAEYPDLLGVLHSNASAAACKLPGKADEAARHADESVRLKPSWGKAYLRQAAAAALRHRPGDAERALRLGLRRCPAEEAAALQRELNKLLQEDGDQSELRGYLPGTPAQKMRGFQAEQGMAMHGPAALAALPCDAFRYAFLGDWEGFRSCFRPAEHISLRAWALRLPLPAVIVAGAQRIKLVASQRAGDGHAAILRQVCEAGCRVDAKDIAGWTALAHATAHHPQLELARILLEHGADPSGRTRMGCSHLHHAIMAQELEVVRLLLDAGADPRVRDLDGISVEDTAKHNPHMLALVHKSMGAHQQNAHLQSGGACFACGNAGASRRCECRAALYCSRTCQRAHWKQHRPQCTAAGRPHGGSGAAASTGTPAGAGAGGSASSSGGAGAAASKPPGQLRVRPSEPPEPYYSTLPSQTLAGIFAAATGMSSRAPPPLGPDSMNILGPAERAAAATRPNSKTFVIKVQVPLDGQGPLLIYNKSRSYQIWMDPTQGPDAQRLVGIVQREGWRGAKAYFNAYVDAESGELVVSEAVLPTQTW